MTADITSESEKQRRALLCLNTQKGLSSRRLLQILETPASLSAVYENLTVEQKEWLSGEERLCGELGVSVVTLLDALYPALLKQIPDPPAVLYMRGNIEALRQAPAVAVVGSRRCCSYGLRSARRLGRELAQAGFAVVSGLALGADAEAHRGCLEAGGKTVAVMGRGLEQIYPASNRKLAEEIVQQGGVLVSEFPMTLGPLAVNFPRRNRIISGLSLGVVVIQAVRRSGALVTARMALEQNREVFALPGQADSPLSAGPHDLLRQGAALVESAEDICEALRWGAPRPANPELLPGTFEEPDESEIETRVEAMTEAEGILKLLARGKASPDSLIQATGLKPGALAEILLDLELQGRVKNNPGQVWSLTR